MKIPVTVHIGDSEKTLEVTSLDDDDLDYVDISCYSCGTSSRTVKQPFERRALDTAQAAITETLTEAFVMTELD